MLFTVLLTGCVSLANNWLEHEGTYLVAHRGAHIIAPENTVESIHQAKILGTKQSRLMFGQVETA